MKAILVILATLGSMDLDKVKWQKMPRLMRKDIRRYYKLERQEIRKTLKKIKRLDDIHYIPLYRDYDINKVARSSTNESDFGDFINTRKHRLG